MEPIHNFLDLVKVAHPKSNKNLTLFPLLAPETAEPDFLTIDGQEKLCYFKAIQPMWSFLPLPLPEED